MEVFTACTCSPEARLEGSARATCPLHGIVASTPTEAERAAVRRQRVAVEQMAVKGLGLLPHEYTLPARWEGSE